MKVRKFAWGGQFFFSLIPWGEITIFFNLHSKFEFSCKKFTHEELNSHSSEFLPKSCTKKNCDFSQIISVLCIKI